MKILLAITELGAGGAEKIIAVLAGKMIRRGHSVTVVSLQKRPEEHIIPDILQSVGAKMIFLDIKKGQWNILSRIRTVVRNEAPDIVHTHLMHPNLLFRLAMIGMKIPLVNTIHISERRHGKKAFFLLDRMTFFLADAVTAVSDASARFHECACGLPPGKIQTIRNGSDPVVPASGKRLREFANILHLDQYSAVIGSIGRLNWQKGYDLLLERADSIAAKVPADEKWLLLILGEGPERKKLETIIQSKSFHTLDICLAGFQKDAASLMTCFNVFLMPSRYEGYGLALAEAMSLGLPVVCSDADSLPELCRQYNGFYRIICMDSDLDGEQWASAVKDAVTAKRTDGQILSTADTMTEQYQAVYEKTLRRRKSFR